MNETNLKITLTVRCGPTSAKTILFKSYKWDVVPQAGQMMSFLNKLAIARVEFVVLEPQNKIVFVHASFTKEFESEYNKVISLLESDNWVTDPI